MNKPDQEQIDHWLTVAQEGIEKKWELYRSGFYEQKQLPVQGMYCTLALKHSSLGRAKFLNGDSLEEVRAEFAQAARHVLKSFTMAYDKNNPDYQGDQVEWAAVMETDFIEGLNYALMAADFELARELAHWFQDRGNGKKMDPIVNHYAHALKETLLGNTLKAQTLLQLQLDDYEYKPPKHPWEKNYLTMITALMGILTGNQAQFNEGLLKQLEFYDRHLGQGEFKNTDEEFIDDYAVALANLGLKQGLTVTVAHDLLPSGLLLRAN